MIAFEDQMMRRADSLDSAAERLGAHLEIAYAIARGLAKTNPPKDSP